jgi:hypothetical protein
VTCPYCALAAPRRALHRHLAEQHADRVMTEVVEAEGRMLYRVACPHCGGEIQHQVKPRWRDPGFLAEFGREIRLVAFDLLLLHLEDAHEPAVEA